MVASPRSGRVVPTPSSVPYSSNTRWDRSRFTPCRAAAGSPDRSPPTFPSDYNVLVRDAQSATLAAIADGHRLLEVEFPVASLMAVQGDEEGANEMTKSSEYLRQYARMFLDKASKTRVFFPDVKECQLQSQGVWSDFPSINLDYLTKPSGLLDIGIDISGYDPCSKVQSSETVFLAAVRIGSLAPWISHSIFPSLDHSLTRSFYHSIILSLDQYPSFDPRELVATDKVWKRIQNDGGKTLVIFNAELCRLRSDYFPALFYPEMARLSKEMVPLIETGTMGRTCLDSLAHSLTLRARSTSFDDSVLHPQLQGCRRWRPLPRLPGHLASVPSTRRRVPRSGPRAGGAPYPEEGEPRHHPDGYPEFQ